MKGELITRRAALFGTLGTGGLMLSGCDDLGQNRSFARMLEAAEKLSFGGQRLLLNSSAPLAREYQKSDISRVFKANGTTRPDTDVYKRLQMTQFADWRLQIDGLVDQPLTLSLDDLRARPARTVAVTMECAGNGRARLEPRPVSQPWLVEAALIRLGDRRLTPEQQATIVKATRTPHKVRWPGWWEQETD